MRSEVESLRSLIAEGRPNLYRLAQLAGVSRGTLYNFLDPDRTPRAATIASLSAGLRLLEAEAPEGARTETVEQLHRELRHAASFDRRTARDRSRELAKELVVRVTAARDLQYVRDEVARSLESTVRSAVGTEATAARLALARVALESAEYDRTLELTSTVPAGEHEQWRVARWISSEALRMCGQWSEARRAARDALHAEDPAVRAWAHWNLAKLAEKSGDYAAARRDFGAAMRVCRTAVLSEWERRDIEAWSLWGIAWTEMRTGTPEAAVAAFRQASQIAPDGDAGVRLWIAHGLAEVLALTGQLDEARELYLPLIELARAIGNEHYLGWMYASLGEIALTQGAYGAAIEWGQSAVRVNDRYAGPSAPSRPSAAALVAFAEGARGTRPWREVATVISALAARARGYPLARCAILLRAAEAERLAGRPAQSMAIVEDVGQLATKHRLKIHRAAAQLATATLLLTDPAKRADGLAALRRAQRTYESLQAAWGIARCLLLAKAYGVRVDESRTRELVRGRFPIEAAELGLVERRRPPQAPLSHPGG